MGATNRGITKVGGGDLVPWHSLLDSVAETPVRDSAGSCVTWRWRRALAQVKLLADPNGFRVSLRSCWHG